MTWPALLSLAAGTYLIRLLGLLLPGRVRVSAHVERYFDLGATALLLALVAVSTFTQDGGFAGWARRSACWSARWRPGGGCRSCSS